MYLPTDSNVKITWFTRFFQKEGPIIDVPIKLVDFSSELKTGKKILDLPMGYHGSKELHWKAHVEEYESKYPKIAAEMKKGECSLL